MYRRTTLSLLNCVLVGLVPYLSRTRHHPGQRWSPNPHRSPCSAALLRASCFSVVAKRRRPKLAISLRHTFQARKSSPVKPKSVRCEEAREHVSTCEEFYRIRANVFVSTVSDKHPKRVRRGVLQHGRQCL